MKQLRTIAVGLAALAIAGGLGGCAVYEPAPGYYTPAAPAYGYYAPGYAYAPAYDYGYYGPAYGGVYVGGGGGWWHGGDHWGGGHGGGWGGGGHWH